MIFKDISDKLKYSRLINTKERYVFFLFNTSCELRLDIVEEGIEVYIFGLFIGEKKNVHNLFTLQRHRVKNCKSSLFINGVFSGHSRFSHKGLIRIEKEAGGSGALQRTHGLILSGNPLVDSKPYLEIMAKDVKCSHNVALGKINQESLLYAQTRTINRKKAENLMIRGFLNDFFQSMRLLGCVRQADSVQSKYLSGLNLLC